MKKIVSIGICLLLLIGFTGCSKKEEKTTVLITVKNYGEILVELDPTYTPRTVENFLSLVEKGFYNGLTFHRVLNGFMIQGGDPLGTGMGGSGKTIIGEFEKNGIKNPLSHVRGVISMARSDNSYNSASSQFFIVQQDSPHLDSEYASFGKVISGMEIVDKIAKETKTTGNDGLVEKENQPRIQSIEIVENQK